MQQCLVLVLFSHRVSLLVKLEDVLRHDEHPCIAKFDFLF